MNRAHSTFFFLLIPLLIFILDPHQLPARTQTDTTIQESNHSFATGHDLMHKHETNSRAAVKSLIEGLSSSDVTIRRNAAFALGEIGRTAEPSTAALSKTLKNDPDIDVRKNAAFALGEIGSPSIPVLIDSMNDQDPRVRRSVFAALVRIGLPAVPALINALDNPDNMIRINAASILGRIGHRAKDAVANLEKHLSTDDEAFLWTVREALRRIRLVTVDDLIVSLNDKDVTTRINAAVSLAEKGSDALVALPYLIDCLNDEKHEMRKTVSDAVISFGQEAIPYLLGALKNDDPNIRRNAAYCLGEIGKPAEAAIPALKKLLHDSNKQVTWVADNAIKKIRASVDEDNGH